MSKGKGFLAGLLFSGVAAAAGYAYFKSLSPAEQEKLKAKVDDIVVDVRDKAVDYTYAATDAVASVRDRADDFVAEKGLDGKVADLKAQADEKTAGLRAKADDLKAQAQDLADQAKSKASEVKDQVRAKVAPELEDEDIDIVLDPTAPSLSEAFEDLEEPVAVEEAKQVTAEVLEPEGGLSETNKKGLSEEA
ncbi:hypothetical protein [Weissella confusa]|uniref:hypothetical protein n=1 Tax=Weissella confusa TaxID=1583 RepID=UPI0018F1EF04|nr:hypothetical protein [Weissella confusa]MBJ7686676.1 hypothetical protein [Weissella confusa]MBJ7696954.1 hypothetical protein [Weissella confusa]